MNSQFHAIYNRSCHQIFSCQNMKTIPILLGAITLRGGGGDSLQFVQDDVRQMSVTEDHSTRGRQSDHSALM